MHPARTLLVRWASLWRVVACYKRANSNASVWKGALCRTVRTVSTAPAVFGVYFWCLSLNLYVQISGGNVCNCAFITNVWIRVASFFAKKVPLFSELSYVTFLKISRLNGNVAIFFSTIGCYTICHPASPLFFQTSYETPLCLWKIDLFL